ncbi:hypothetical protein GE107_16010 [Cohnella sp. CFH 77786]|uniref:hypothetical protein n=1 Tax=Cohnella sp. CFH 77786 TaxID=2662265 RepID=UPI001C60E1AE|nr:hypothetical protein [Cohnella sp. CFH 77786]MBW5447563.1 hypothetical protein [Cohnella sp. CFH 77786]
MTDLYIEPDPEQDVAMLRDMREQDQEGAETIIERMPAWKRWGYEEGIAEGIEKGQD